MCITKTGVFMAKLRDVSGVRFGRLVARERVGRDRFKIAIWNCICDCGNRVDVRLCSLNYGATKSCGCLNNESRIKSMVGNLKAKTHGLSDHYLYRTWATMKQRCINPNSAKYKHYGGRGISVCSDWVDSFEKFLLDMGDRPNGCSLNRKDNDGDYSKENCEWQSYSEQNRNRRKYKRNKV